MRNFCFAVLFLFFLVSFGQDVTVIKSFSDSGMRKTDPARCMLNGNCAAYYSAIVASLGFFSGVNLGCSSAFLGLVHYGSHTGVCVPSSYVDCTVLSRTVSVSTSLVGSCTGTGSCTVSGGDLVLGGFGSQNQCYGSCLPQIYPIDFSVSGTITLSCPADFCERAPDLCPSSSSAPENSSSSEFDSSSSSEEGASSSSSGDWVSSSSSEERGSSSSSGDWVSSSSRAEDGDCYGSELEASYAFSTKLIQCQANGGDISEMKLAGRCITGSCRSPFSSSSLGGMGSSSSSFGGGGGEDVCVAARQFLQKTADVSDNWVYIGKEVYGSQKARRPAPKFTSKFFDVLGRTYDRVMGRKKYYTREPLPVGQEYEFAKEFEVWARIIKDSEGRDIHVFRKEDKLRKFRRDSSFYWDGRWEVFEFDDLARETRYRTSSGTRSLRKYDSKKRLIENYLTNGKGDTLISEQYFWGSERLVRMIENGLERKYIYGKNSLDTIRVIPSDHGVRSHSGYDGSVGKIPSENDPMYKFFALDPYKYTKHESDDDESDNSTYNVFALFKLPSEGLPNFFCKEIRTTHGMPPVECIRYTRKYVSQRANIRYPYPHKNGLFIYGEADSELPKKINCKCIDGKFYIDYKHKPINEYIQVVMSGWRYNNAENTWMESCWMQNELQSTYNHETFHIDNMRKAADVFYLKFFKEEPFDTEKECLRKGEEQLFLLELAWGLWYQDEKKHGGDRWENKVYGEYREGIRCTN